MGSVKDTWAAAAAAAWTPQTQGSSRWGTELSWGNMWRWQVNIYILPLTESKILSNSREAVLFHWKPQSWFVSVKCKCQLSWRNSHRVKNWFCLSWILLKCGSLPLPLPPAWEIFIRNTTFLPLFHLWDKKVPITQNKKEKTMKMAVMLCTIYQVRSPKPGMLKNLCIVSHDKNFAFKHTWQVFKKVMQLVWLTTPATNHSCSHHSTAFSNLPFITSANNKSSAYFTSSLATKTFT